MGRCSDAQRGRVLRLHLAERQLRPLNSARYSIRSCPENAGKWGRVQPSQGEIIFPRDASLTNNSQGQCPNTFRPSSPLTHREPRHNRHGFSVSAVPRFPWLNVEHGTTAETGGHNQHVASIIYAYADDQELLTHSHRRGRSAGTRCLGHRLIAR
jgi:hypothetical protein